MLPSRKRLPHTPPPWVPDASLFFITICCKKRYHNSLATPSTAGSLFESIDYRATLGHWNPHLFLLMPDHLHAFITFAPHKEMKAEVKAWKRYTARHFKIDWQDDFFDHRIRNDAELREKWSYVLNNSVRANLSATSESWPHLRHYQ